MKTRILWSKKKKRKPNFWETSILRNKIKNVLNFEIQKWKARSKCAINLDKYFYGRISYMSLIICKISYLQRRCGEVRFMDQPVRDLLHLVWFSQQWEDNPCMTKIIKLWVGSVEFSIEKHRWARTN